MIDSVAQKATRVSPIIGNSILTRLFSLCPYSTDNPVFRKGTGTFSYVYSNAQVQIQNIQVGGYCFLL